MVKGVAVFALVEATHGGDAARVAQISACGDNGLRKVVEEVRFGGGR